MDEPFTVVVREEGVRTRVIPAEALPPEQNGSGDAQPSAKLPEQRTSAAGLPPALLSESLLGELHRDYAPALMAYASRLAGGDHGRAQDAVQETFIRAWQHPSVLDTSRGSTRGWLMTTVRNVLIDEHRARQSRPQVVSDVVEDAAESRDEISRLLATTLVNDALRSLSEPHREVLLHCYYGGLSVVEAAHRLGVPDGTIKSRLYYGLRALKAALAERGLEL